MRYRAEIDGLRAIAVVPVILFHVGFEWFSGGFVGVDIFFVISGYLITSIILSEMEEKRFSLLNFYERRARRILPALYIVLFVCALYQYYYQSPFAARDLSQSIFATTLFTQNFLLLFESNNYFDLSAELKPLLHTWSLAVEEQYYVIFPLLLLVIWRFGKPFVYATLLLIGFISLGLAHFNVSESPSSTFYMLHTRMWEILLGAFACFYIRRVRAEEPSPIVSQALSALGLGLIVLSIVLFDARTPFPSLYALVPTVGTVLLILFATENTVVKKVLSNKVFVFIGLISYSAYLWHQPILAVLRVEFMNLDIMVMAAITIVMTGLLAYASYRFIETPIRRGALSSPYFAGSVVVATIALLSFSYFGHSSMGYESVKLEAIDDSNQTLYISYHREQRKRALMEKELLQEASANDDDGMVYVIGDSMSAEMATALEMRGIESRRIEFDGSCWGEFLNEGEACGLRKSDLLNQLKDGRMVILASDFSKEHSVDSAIAMRGLLEQNEIPSKVLGTLRFRHIANTSFQFMKDPPSDLQLDEYFYQSLDERMFAANEELEQAISEEDFIDKFELFCDETQKTCRFYTEKRSPLFYDELHLTVEGMEVYGRQLERMLNVS